MKNPLLQIIILSLLSLVMFLAVTQPPKNYHPAVEIEMNDQAGALTIAFLLRPRLRQSECEAIGGNIGRVMIENCTQCRIKKLGCKIELGENDRTLLSETPLAMPSARMANGVITFHSTSPSLALAACQASEARSANSSSPVKCYAADVVRIKSPSSPVLIHQHLILLMSAFAVAWFTCWLIIRYEHLHAHFSHDHVASGPQKYHAQPTPRIGGLAIIFGLIAAGGIMLIEDALISEYAFGLLVLAGIPAFLGGLTEDITKRVGVSERLLLTMLSGASAAWLLGAVLNRLDVPIFDHALMWLPLAVVFTAFAVGGVANSINIIDGYNGLASGFAIIVLIAMAYIANTVGDRLVFSTSLALMGALLGFLVWNWPHGKLFMGDGGAYLVGFVLAELAVLIVIRNPAVSPWFPLLLLIYPIFETFYSIYRRKLKNKLSPGQPDNRHLHQLVHDYLIPHEASRGEHSRRNSRVAKYFCMPTVALATLSVIFWDSTPALATCTLGFCVLYVVNYRRVEKAASMSSALHDYHHTTPDNP